MGMDHGGKNLVDMAGKAQLYNNFTMPLEKQIQLFICNPLLIRL